MRWRKVIVRGLLFVLVCIALGLGELYWASRSETVLRWAIEQAAKRMPGKLTVDGIHGSITEPIAIDSIQYKNDDITVDARQVSLDWSAASSLLGQRITIRQLRIGTLRVVLANSAGPRKPVVLPDSLALPIPVQVESLEIQRLAIAGDFAEQKFDNISIAYSGDGQAHQVKLTRFTAAWGTLAAEFKLAAPSPFPLSGTARVNSSAVDGWPIAADAQFGGTLQRMQTALQVKVRDIPIIGGAQITPFEPIWLQTLTARTESLDIKRLVGGAPGTALDATFEGRGVDSARIAGNLSVTNRLAGTLDQQRLPVRSISGAVTADLDGVALSEARVDLGSAGSGKGQAALHRDATTATLKITNLDLRHIHAALRQTHLAGTVSVTVNPRIEEYKALLEQDRMRVAFTAQREGDAIVVSSLLAQVGSAQAHASGKLVTSSPYAFSVNGDLKRFDPAAFGNFPPAAINGAFAARGTLDPAWQITLNYRLAASVFRGQPLSGDGKLSATARRVHDVDARLALGGNRLQMRGAFGQSSDALDLTIEAPQLKAIGPDWAGNASLAGRITGNFDAPGCELQVSGKNLTAPGGYRAGSLIAHATLTRADDPRFDVRVTAQDIKAGKADLQTASLETSGSFSHHTAHVRAKGEQLDFDTQLQGGWISARREWQGSVQSLENRGAYAVHLAAAMPLIIARQRVLFGPARLQTEGGEIDIDESRYTGQALASSGALHNISTARLFKLIDPSIPLQSTVILDGRWSVAAGEHLNGHLELIRQSGDVTALTDVARLPLGLSRLSARADIVQDRVVADAIAEGTRFGRAAAQMETRIERRDGRWGMSGRAPLTLSAHAELAALKPLVALYTKAIAIDGQLALDVRGSGTIERPDLQGTASLKQLSFNQAENGIALHDGVLRATFTGHSLDVSEFSILGGKGRLSATGQATLQNQHLRSKIDWTASELAAIQRPDVAITVSGRGTLVVADDKLTVAGDINVDHGRVELQASTAPTLSDDVVVVGSKPRSAGLNYIVSPTIDVRVDLGPDFSVRGQGLDARATGKLRVQSPGNAAVTAKGDISVTRGTYEAYGYTLEIERGKLHFAGPINNPALDIRAMRKNQQVEAGVEVTGTARAPLVRLVSVPDVADPDKLSWLVLGHGPESNSRSDTQALQSSAALLLAGAGTSPLQTRIAKSLGLDEVTVSADDAIAPGGVVTLSKRISQRIYVSFEQSLATASNAIKVNYQLTRRWSLRTESGKTDAVDLFYSFSFD
ncbi:MAG: translocation/assembly module TamB domain-containing protein [Betaproteobacteria bacterium]